MKKTRKELEKECTEAAAKVEQYQHRGQRYENRIRYYTQGERKKRNEMVKLFCNTYREKFHQ